MTPPEHQIVLAHLDGCHGGTEVGEVVEEDSGRGRRKRPGRSAAAGDAAALCRDGRRHLEMKEVMGSDPSLYPTLIIVIKLMKTSSSCSTVVESTPLNREIVGLNPTGCFFLLLSSVRCP